MRVVLAFGSTADRNEVCRRFDGLAGSSERLGLVVMVSKRLRSGQGLAWAAEAWGRAGVKPKPTGGYFQDIQVED